MKITTIEKESVERDYGFKGVIAIIEHPQHGRLLVQDGYGGESTLSGGAVRWEHGSVHRLMPGDTLEGLRAAKWNDWTDMLYAVKHCLDGDRPLLTDFSGSKIKALAKSANL